MWTNLTRSLRGGGEDSDAILREDPLWGFVEFPSPGDTKKHLLPQLIDPDEVAAAEAAASSANVKNQLLDNGLRGPKKEFWMPDSYCKVCYGCEEPFTMTRRRHHCRMCGQVFCHNCSAYSIDGVLFNTPGSVVRACRPCFDQVNDLGDVDLRALKRRLAGSMTQSLTMTVSSPVTSGVGGVESLPVTRVAGEQVENRPVHVKASENLNNRALSHLTAVVDQLVQRNALLCTETETNWRQLILQMSRTVVANVDPDVRSAGDSLDPRAYVKIKVIPGGKVTDCAYVDGVVFRKNVAHKKMMRITATGLVEQEMDDGTVGVIPFPRVLVLTGGIEFQRTEGRLSSMDTLIEAEDKFLELLVEKLMSLSPTVIFVGRSVSRRALELLCDHNVAVVQNVKQEVLERVARMTGAILLASTDNMIQQYGEDCLGTDAAEFRLRLVRDDPEHAIDESTGPRVLRQRVNRGSTYVHLTGCPPHRGASVVLRGSSRAVLTEVHRVLHAAIIVAYHLRLEVAFYNDRHASLPAQMCRTVFDDSSDVDDEVVDISDPLEIVPGSVPPQTFMTEFNSRFPHTNPTVTAFAETHLDLYSRAQRQLLSTSLDVDPHFPYRHELVGTSLFRGKALNPFSIISHDTLLVTSVLMGGEPHPTTNVPQQKSPADIKGIKFYTKQDVALGQFLITSCFQLSSVSQLRDGSVTGGGGGGSNAGTGSAANSGGGAPGGSGVSGGGVREQQISFVQRPGRIDITISRNTSHHPPAGNTAVGAAGHNPDAVGSFSDENVSVDMYNNAQSNTSFSPNRLPIYMSSYCKECRQTVLTPHVISEETWKMSFGKFLEILFYNRSACCVSKHCNHSLRDDHILTFSCEGYQAKMEFVPIHAYALSLRGQMTFPSEFYWKLNVNMLVNLPEKHQALMDEFRGAICLLEAEARDLLLMSAGISKSNPTGSGIRWTEDLPLAIAQVRLLELEVAACGMVFLEELIKTLQNLPPGHRCTDTEELVRQQLRRQRLALRSLQNGVIADGSVSISNSPALTQYVDMHVGSNSEQGSDNHNATDRALTNLENSDLPPSELEMAVDLVIRHEFCGSDVHPFLASKYPHVHLRDTVMRASVWNNRLASTYKFLDSGRHLLNLAVAMTSGSERGAEAVTAAEWEEAEDTFVEHRKHLSEVVSAHNYLATATTDEAVAMALGNPTIVVASSNSNAITLTESSTDSTSETLSEVGAEESERHSLLESAASSAAVATTLAIRNGRVCELFRALASYQAHSSVSAPAVPTEKVSRVTKALNRLLAGTGSGGGTSGRHEGVVLSDLFGSGRFRLPPGRNGEVIAVNEDVYASIIAYALASDDYYDELNEEDAAELAASAAEAEARAAAEEAAEAEARAAAAARDLSSDTERVVSTGQVSNHATIAAAAAAAAKARRRRAAEEDDDEDDLTAHPTATSDFKSLMRNFSPSEIAPSGAAVSGFGATDRLFDGASPAGTVVNADAALGTVPGSHNSSVETASPAPPTSHDSNLPPRPPLSGAQFKRTASTHMEEGISALERTLISQEKNDVRIRFQDCDERGNVLAKFQCQIYWARQFEALRQCYFGNGGMSGYSSVMAAANAGNGSTSPAAATAVAAAAAASFGSQMSFGTADEARESFIRSLACSRHWNASGGKSGAMFAKSADDRLVIKAISKVETQMFLDFAPAYFEYMAKAYFHSLPTVLCKVLGVFTIKFEVRDSGEMNAGTRRVTENLVVMENLFYERAVTKTFDLKGSSRVRYSESARGVESLDSIIVKRRIIRRKVRRRSTKTKPDSTSNLDEEYHSSSDNDEMDSAQLAEEYEAINAPVQPSSAVFMEDNLMEFTRGRPFPLKYRAKLFLNKAVQNDTLFLSIVNVVDYSIIVGLDENGHELMVGIIDYLRQYDIIKKMERVGKGSVGILTGQAAPTIIEPSQYRKRFTTAMDRYFMPVPDKWIYYDST